MNLLCHRCGANLSASELFCPNCGSPQLKFAQQEEGLGKLSFPTSCDPKVQAEFERGVAMLHSYWFTVARRTFEGVLREDPNCAMAYWGCAMANVNNEKRAAEFIGKAPQRRH